MRKHLPAIQSIFLTACLLWLTACSPQAPIIVKTEINPTGTHAQQEQGQVPVSTLTPTPTATQAPVDTAVPTTTPTQWPSQPITAENAGSLKEVNRWGRGSVIQIQKLENRPGEYLVLASPGLYWYGSTAPFLLNFAPDVDDFILSPDERWLAAGMKNGDVMIVDTGSWSLKQTISHQFPEDILHRIENMEILPFYAGGMAFSPDGSQIAIGYADGKIELWRLGETAPYATLQHDALALWNTDVGLLFHLSFSPDGQVLTAYKYAPYLHANRLTFWSLPEGKLLSVSEAGRYDALPQETYLPDGKTILVTARDASYLRLQLWDIQTGKRVSDFPTGLSRIDSTALTPEGARLTVTGSDAQGNNIRQVWSLPEGKQVESEKLDQLPKDEELARFEEFLREQGHYYNAWGSEEHSGQARLVSEDALPMQVLEETYLLNIPAGNTEPAKVAEDVTNAYYDPQGKFIAWCEPGRLVIQDQDGTATSTELPFHSDCDGVAVSSQKHYVALWKGPALYIQDLQTGKYSKPVFDWRWRNSPMLAARFSEDEKILITSMTAYVAIWQLDPLQKIADSHNENWYVGNNLKIALTKDKVSAVTLSVSRGNTSDRSSQILVWRVADGFIRHRINPPFIGESQPMFTSFSLSPDGSLIASGDDFGGIRFWSLESGEQAGSFNTGQRPLDLAFTPDGSGLVVVLGDGTTRLYGVP